MSDLHASKNKHERIRQQRERIRYEETDPQKSIFFSRELASFIVLHVLLGGLFIESIRMWLKNPKYFSPSPVAAILLGALLAFDITGLVISRRKKEFLRLPTKIWVLILVLSVIGIVGISVV